MFALAYPLHFFCENIRIGVPLTFYVCICSLCLRAALICYYGHLLLVLQLRV